MSRANNRLVKILLSVVLVVSLVPLMGSHGCRSSSSYTGFDFGFDFLPTWGGYGYYETSYQETFIETGFFYDDGYYGGGYYDDWWWKKKNSDQKSGVSSGVSG